MKSVLLISILCLLHSSCTIYQSEKPERKIDLLPQVEDLIESLDESYDFSPPTQENRVWY